jgi:hypothetical protein
MVSPTFIIVSHFCVTAFALVFTLSLTRFSTVFKVENLGNLGQRVQELCDRKIYARSLLLFIIIIN